MQTVMSLGRLGREIARGCAVVVAITCSGCVSNPVGNAGAATIRYFEAKKQLANQLQAALAGTATNKYRLLAVNGPAYPIGAVLDPENPSDLVTRNCILKTLPPSEPWSAFPKWQSSTTIGLGLGWPVQFQRAAAIAGLKVKNTTSTSFEMSEISQVLVAHADFVAHIGAPACMEMLDTLRQDVLIVRGVISGRESLTGGPKLESSVYTQLVETTSDLIRVSYDKSGNFELRDEKPFPKFVVLTRLAAAERTTIDGALIPPTDAQLEKLEQWMANQSEIHRPR